jgi:hypothetical protein
VRTKSHFKYSQEESRLKLFLLNTCKFLMVGNLLILNACASRPLYQTFVPNQKIQVIKLNENESLFVQNDRLMNFTNFADNYKDRKPEWKVHFDKANYEQNIQASLVVFQFASLFTCISTSYFPAVMAWCGSSIGSSYFVGQQTLKINKEQSEVVDQYNSILEKTGDINKSVP